MEMHSSDLLEERLLLGAEMAGSPSCSPPCELWFHAFPGFFSQWLSMVGLLVPAIPWDLGLLPLTGLRISLNCPATWGPSYLIFPFLYFFTGIRPDLWPEISFCLFLFPSCLLTETVNTPKFACQILPWLPGRSVLTQLVYYHIGNTAPLSRDAIVSQHGTILPVSQNLFSCTEQNMPVVSVTKNL